MSESGDRVGRVTVRSLTVEVVDDDRDFDLEPMTYGEFAGLLRGYFRRGKRDVARERQGEMP